MSDHLAIVNDNLKLHEVNTSLPPCHQDHSEKFTLMNTVNAKNPLNANRACQTEAQLIYWLAGISIHNGRHDIQRNHTPPESLIKRSLPSNEVIPEFRQLEGECTPDFSCCHPDLTTALKERIRYTMNALKLSILYELRSLEPENYDDEIDTGTIRIVTRAIDRYFNSLTDDIINNPLFVNL